MTSKGLEMSLNCVVCSEVTPSMATSLGVCETCNRISFEKALSWHIYRCEQGCTVDFNVMTAACPVGEHLMESWTNALRQEI